MAKKDVIKGFISQRGWEEKRRRSANAAVAVQLHPTLCGPMNCSMLGLPALSRVQLMDTCKTAKGHIPKPKRGGLKIQSRSATSYSSFFTGARYGINVNTKPAEN